MNSAIAAKPHSVELKPFLMLSAPSDGPMVRSSMMSIGAASAAGAQQQRGVVGFHGAHAAGNLHAAAADLGADHRRGDHLALALLDQQDGHALADVVARDVLEDAGAGGVERQVHGRLLRLVVEAGLGVGQAVAGQHHLLLDQQRLAAALVVDLGAERRVAGQRGIEGAGRVVDHADFERCGAAEDVLGLGRVLHAGQLDDDAVGALLLDDRLGDAELVDPVVQRRDVLLQREFAQALDRFRLERGDQPRLGRVALFGEDQVRLAVGDRVASPCRASRRRGT